MKYICLGFYQPEKVDNMSRVNATPCLMSVLPMTTSCAKNGHFAGGEALQPTNAAVSVYSKNGKVAVTDGRSVRGNEGAIGWDSGA
jgi:hypothetical protein